MIGRVRWRFPDVDSTQRIAFRIAESGARHGTVVRADFQTAGVGRQGRRWESSPGSALMFSVILRPTFPINVLGPISILAAGALADEISLYTNDLVQVKWPNDVLIDGLKASGILLQTRSGPDPLAVLGLGINLNTQRGSLPAGATSLAAHSQTPVDIEAFFNALLARLDAVWNGYKATLDAQQVAVLESGLWQLGEMVTIIDADREVAGRILGVARNGGLRLSIDGSERVVVAGEIVRGPRPIQAMK